MTRFRPCIIDLVERYQGSWSVLWSGAASGERDLGTVTTGGLELASGTFLGAAPGASESPDTDGPSGSDTAAVARSGDAARACGVALLRLLGLRDSRRAPLLRDEVDAARARGETVRMLIRYASPWLHAVPWELLHDGAIFLGVHPDLTLARWFRSDRPIRGDAARVSGEALVTLTTDDRLGRRRTLAPEHEVRTLYRTVDNSLGGRIRANQPLEDRSFEDVRHAMRKLRSSSRPPVWWHHAGHGARVGDEYGIIFRDGGGDRCVPASEIAQLVNEVGSLQLVVLACCHSADLLGLTMALAELGVPAAIGFDGKVADDDASRFCATLYHSLREGSSVDIAVRKARLELLGYGDPSQLRRAVFFLRSLEAISMQGIFT